MYINTKFDSNYMYNAIVELCTTLYNFVQLCSTLFFYSLSQICVQPGDEFEAIVSVGESPDDFWCQWKKSSTIELPLLMDQIHDRYQSETATSQDQIELEVGKLCAAQYTDNGWYRAVILEVVEDSAKVCFFDYGNIELVEKSKIRSIQDDLMSLPQQAVACKLAGVEPIFGSWEEESCNRFQELVVLDDGKSFTVKVVSVPTELGINEKIEVELNDNGVIIADLLVEGGYAKSRDEPTASKDGPLNSTNIGGTSFLLDASGIIGPDDTLSVIYPEIGVDSVLKGI